MDAIDRKLLNELQMDASHTNEQIADLVGCSASAASRRITRLENAGIIERRVAIVAPDRVGQPASFLVGIEVERERPELTHALRAWLRDKAAVQQVYYVTGSADYILVVTAPNIAAFDAMMSEMMVSNPNVRRFTTNVVMTTLKRGLTVQVD